MKKIMIIFALFSLIGLQAKGQTYMPCAPYVKSRTLEGMRTILHKDGLYYDNLRSAIAEVVNRELPDSIIPATKQGMDWIIDHSVLYDQSFVTPSDYENGAKSGNSIVYTTLLGNPSSYAVLRCGGGEIVYAKSACMNPQRKKVIVKPTKSLSGSDITDQNGAGKDQPAGGNTYITNYNYYTNEEQEDYSSNNGYSASYYPEDEYGEYDEVQINRRGRYVWVSLSLCPGNAYVYGRRNSPNRNYGYSVNNKSHDNNQNYDYNVNNSSHGQNTGYHVVNKSHDNNRNYGYNVNNGSHGNNQNTGSGSHAVNRSH